jgi:addiction module HigA family antidote
MAKSTAYRYEPDVVFPPGETLAEVLDDLDMTQTELAKRTGLSVKHVNQIINGAAAITTETALLLEQATGVTARVWSNLEIAYREHEARQEEESRLQKDIGWLDELPVKELVSRGWIEDAERPVDLLRRVCRFFGVANREAWDLLWHKPTAYRTSRAFKSDPGAVAAWLRIGEIKATPVECKPFSRGGLSDAIGELRALTRDPDPTHWWPTLVGMCADVGVAVVAEPEIPGARINGAARWLAPDKALVQLSLRHRWNDIFWFTLFHELGHLLIHSKKDAFINDDDRTSGAEQEADAFAAQILIPRKFEAQLGELTTLVDVQDFSAEVGIAAGIVVGRLQHDGLWPFKKGNQLKQRFVFSNN